MFFQPQRKKHRRDAKVAALEKRILDLESQVEARDRTIAVLESENDVMALALARLEERVKADAARYARERSEAENEQNSESQILRRA